MGMDPKYCKVTVHASSIKTSPPPLVRRQTVGDDGLGSFRSRRFKRAPPPVPPYKAHAAALYDDVTEVLEDDIDDIAVLSEEEPLTMSRRRAHTTSSLSATTRLSNILNPLSRMTMRWTEQSADAASNKATESSTSASTTPDLMDTPPPLLTPPAMMDLANSFLDVDTNGSDEILRPTLEDTASLMAGTPPIPAGLTLDMLPTEYETPPIPSHLRDVLLHNQNTISPLVLVHSEDEGESESEIEDDDSSSVTADDYGEDPTNHSVDIDSIRQTRDQAVANFEASFHDPNRRKPRFRTTEVPKRVGGSTRNIRGLSSPPRMLSQIIRPRKATVPHAGTDTDATGSSPQSNENPPVPMYHGQELHLAFKTTIGQTTQVQGHPKRRGGGHTNPFSRRVRCNAVQPYDQLEDSDTLRIIGHTTDGLLRGGDCISFARTDGTVLRMQKMFKKLTFSNKIDVRAKFIITGVPDRTPVTSTSKFYLQSVYDRKKTVGFLPSRRENHPGCLAMYVHRNAEKDKVEPIQFFKRLMGNNSLVFWHHPQQWV